MNVAEHRRAMATSATLKKRIADANQPPTHVSEGVGELVPFPAARQAFVKDALRFVDSSEIKLAYRELVSVTRKHRNRLAKLGVAPDLIEADVNALIEAFGLDGDKAPTSPPAGVWFELNEDGSLGRRPQDIA